MTEHPWKPVPYSCPTNNIRNNIGRAKICPICRVRHKKGVVPSIRITSRTVGNTNLYIVPFNL
jgi:hypothetical protein